MAGAYYPKIVTDGLVLCLDAASRKSYPGSGTAWNDLSGNGNSATLSGGSTFTASKGGGLTFDGTSGVGTVSDSATRITNYNFSLEFVFNFNGNNYTNAPLVCKRNPGNPYNQYCASINNGDPYGGGTGKVLIMFLRDDGNTTQITSSDRSLTYTLTNASSYHCIVTNSISRAQMWVNGSLVATSTATLVSGNFSVPGQNFKIANNNSTLYLGDTIHLVRLYNKTLGDAEVSQNFNATRGRFGI